MNSIRTYSDLLAEKNNLESSLARQKHIVQQDFIELKEEYRSALDVLSSVSKITKLSSSNPLITIGANILGEVFLKNMLLSRSNSIVRFVIPFMAKKVFGYFLRTKVAGDTVNQKKKRAPSF